MVADARLRWFALLMLGLAIVLGAVLIALAVALFAVSSHGAAIRWFL